LTHPIAEATLDIWWDSAQQYLGYLKKHEGMEPSFEHLRNTTLLAKFYSFRLARGNGWNTMKIEFQNLSNLIVFVFYPGNFTGLPAMPETERLATQKWLKDVIARARREAGLPENRKRKATSAHLWQVWETQEEEWKSMMQEYEVSVSGHLGPTHYVPSHGCPLCAMPWLVQENDKEWTNDIAQKCIKAGLGLITSGWGQPPMRPNPLRVMHRFNKVRGLECLQEKCK
jgi:hypothetical protein